MFQSIGERVNRLSRWVSNEQIYFSNPNRVIQLAREVITLISYDSSLQLCYTVRKEVIKLPKNDSYGSRFNMCCNNIE